MSSTPNLIGAFLGTFVQLEISSVHTLGHSINSKAHRGISWDILSTQRLIGAFLGTSPTSPTFLYSPTSPTFNLNFTNFSPTWHQLFTNFTNFTKFTNFTNLSPNGTTFHQLHQISSKFLGTLFTNGHSTFHQISPENFLAHLLNVCSQKRPPTSVLPTKLNFQRFTR